MKNELQKRSKLFFWLLAIRPKTLPASIAPILMGTAMAYGDGGMHLPTAIICALTAVALQIGANLSNDYYDYLKGADTAMRTGPTRVTQAGLIKPASVKIGFIIAFAIAAIGWFFIAAHAGWVVIACGIIAIITGLLYTAGPFPLGYLGLGDLMVFIFFGPAAVAGSYFAQTHTITVPSILAGASAGLISVAILTVNNLRDVESDRISGKRTLAVRFGVSFARWEYMFSLAIACVLPVVMVIGGGAGKMLLLSAVSFPVAFSTIKTVFLSSDGPSLNGALAKTAMVLFLFSVLFSIGWNL